MLPMRSYRHSLGGWRPSRPRLFSRRGPIGTQHVFDQLDDGGVELALNTLTEGGDRFKCSGLLDDDYVAILSADNPASIEPALSIERFAALPHIAVSSGFEDMRFIDEALAGRGLARVVSATVPMNSLS
jgi:LysR substrate binding domain